LNKKEKLPPVKNKGPKQKEYVDQNQENKKTLAVHKDPWLVDSGVEVFQIIEIVQSHNELYQKINVNRELIQNIRTNCPHWLVINKCMTW